MNKLLVLMTLITFLLFFSCECFKNKQDMKDLNVELEKAIFPKGEKASNDYFTGTALLTMLIQRDNNNNYTVADVKFEPGARTNWHTHPKGQNLLVTEGHGFYLEKGRPARALKKGDVVIIPENIEHWHGAAPNSHFTHIAITNYKGEENVTWLKPLTDEEYNDATKYQKH
jgi:quercetin dioxygenase-like cupin family protein